MRRLYQACDALILPSVGEGFPLVIQEALACGLAVICASETVAADQAIENIVTHVAVNSAHLNETMAAWIAGVDDVLVTHSDELQRVRANFASQRYGWPGAILRYNDIIQNICPKPLKEALSP